MKTDIEQTEEMFTRAGVEYTRTHSPETSRQPFNFAPPRVERAETTLVVDGGYAGFYTVLKFNDAGALMSVEAYE